MTLLRGGFLALLASTSFAAVFLLATASLFYSLLATRYSLLLSMFVDECTVKLAAGDGGRGCIAFRREKDEPWGGPNGGDGGRGGDVILLGDVNTNNLVDYKFQPHWHGERGEHGQGSDCHGRDGKPCVLRMPLGTVVIDLATDKPVAEGIADGQQIVLGRGGNGGWGNTHFKTSTNRAAEDDLLAVGNHLGH